VTRENGGEENRIKGVGCRSLVEGGGERWELQTLSDIWGIIFLHRKEDGGGGKCCCASREKTTKELVIVGKK